MSAGQLGLTLLNGLLPVHNTVGCFDQDKSSCAWLFLDLVLAGWGAKAADAGLTFVSEKVAARLAARSAGSAAETGSRAIVDAGKYDYLFGRVASNAHNAPRSVQNAAQLARIGIYDNAEGRALLGQHFDDVVRTDGNIARTFSTEHGDFQVRDSLLSGPGGFVRLESTWQVTGDGLRLTTAIPFGGP